MTTSAENQSFAASMLPAYPLDDAIYWIKKNLEPEDVFEEAVLEKWAIDYVKVEAMPVDELEAWAEANGYIKQA
jgi:hypothetical protein